MQKKFQINWTKIKGGCQSGRKAVAHDSKSDLPLVPAGSVKKLQCVAVVAWRMMRTTTYLLVCILECEKKKSRGERGGLGI